MSGDRARSRRAIDDFVERLPALTIVVGKGGVGKTTCAIGIAGELAGLGEPTLLVSTDPAGSLGPALRTTLVGGAARVIEAVPNLSAMQLDPDEQSPGRTIVRDTGMRLIRDIEAAMKAGDPAAAQLVAADCVTIAELKDHFNWELIGQAAKALGGAEARR